MKRTNKIASQVMKLAHSIKKNYSTFSWALKAAWKIVKPQQIKKEKTPTAVLKATLAHALPDFLDYLKSESVDYAVINNGDDDRHGDYRVLYVFDDDSALIIRIESRYSYDVRAVVRNGGAELLKTESSKPFNKLYKVCGETFKNKDLIKKMGGFWNSYQKFWSIDRDDATKFLKLDADDIYFVGICI